MAENNRILRFRNRFRELNEAGKLRIEDIIVQFRSIDAAPADSQQSTFQNSMNPRKPMIHRELPALNEEPMEKYK
jgi:hypothetical protein